MAERAPSLKVDVFYGLMTLGTAMLWVILSGWLMYFYLPPEGAPLVAAPLYGAVMLAVRVVNAVLALPVGRWSDHTRSRWGRRLPFMFWSGLPLVLFFVLLWTPPVRGESVWNLVYLAVVLLVYNVAYTLHQIPYTALLPELALADEHRVRMSGWMSGFMLLGMILGGLAGPLIERMGYVATAAIYAAATLPLFYLPFLVLRERPGRQIRATERLDFREGLAVMRRNRPFLVMTAAGILYWGVTTLVQGAVPYIVTEVCLASTADTMYFYLAAVLASLACYPLVTWAATRWGKWPVFAGSLAASAAVLPLLLVIGNLPGPAPRTQGLIWITLQAVAMSAVMVLPPAFGAEITDYDEQLTGQRREGAYYATWGLLDQVISGVAAAGLPLLLRLGSSRYDPHGPLGVRMVGVVSGVLMLLSFLIFLRYPLRREGVRDA